MTTQPAGGDGPGTTAPVCYRHPQRQTYVSCQRCGRPICPDCMTPASVGFQCPSCVGEGRRTTRSAQAPYGGKVRVGPPVVTYTIMALNGLLWVAVLATGWRSSGLIDRLALVPKGICQATGADAGKYYPQATSSLQCSGTPNGHWVAGVADGSLWELITSAFLHVEIWHIGSNMLALYFIGPQLERVLGRGRYVALYLISGLAGSALAMVFSGPQSASLGASGAIFGLLGAMLILAHRLKAELRPIVSLIVLNLVITFAVPNISWEAHVGGFVAGAAVTAVLAYTPRGPRRTIVQTGGLIAVTALTIVVIAVRVAVLS